MDLICGTFVSILGLAIGSFLNVCIHRLPKGQAVTGRSCCPSCGAGLRIKDLVPVLSYVLSLGRCRFCGAPIGIRYPLVELLTATVFLNLFFFRENIYLFLGDLYLSALLIAAAVIDFYHRLIPNRLVAAGFAGGFVWAAVGVAKGEFTWWNSFAGAAAAGGFLLLMSVLSKGGMGGGDIKLAGVIGFFLGWPQGLLAVLLACCVAGVLGVFLLLTGIKGRKDVIPFAPFLLAGTLMILLWGFDLQYFYWRHIIAP